MRWKRYRKEEDHSYSFGAFPTMELLKVRPDLVIEIILSSSFTDLDQWKEFLDGNHISYRISDKDIARLANKGNVYVVGVFQKLMKPVKDFNHVVCDQISDMGNLGNICRTMVAFGIFDLVTIGKTCDIYNPKTVRASMGSLFRIRHSHYDTIEEYMEEYGHHQLQLFMLSEEAEAIGKITVPEKWALVFGNEGAGLPEEYSKLGRSVIIPQSPYVDSLNLTTAVAIGLYHYTNGTLG